MADLAVIERQIEELDDTAFARLREWFADRDQERWERQIADDAAAGRLDFLAAEALAEHRAGKTRPL
jgi:hypothetical protein